MVSVLTKHADTMNYVLEYFDKDKDGNVTLESWSRGCRTLNDALPEEERIDAGELFRVLDFDGDGVISADEMLNYLKVSGELEERSIYKRKERAFKAAVPDPVQH